MSTDHTPNHTQDFQLRVRRGQAWWGGLMAGVAIGIGMAIVMYAMNRLSPDSAANCGNGCGYSITGNVVLVLFLGLMIGIGLGMGFAAAVPDRTAEVDRAQD